MLTSSSRAYGLLRVWLIYPIPPHRENQCLSAPQQSLANRFVVTDGTLHPLPLFALGFCLAWICAGPTHAVRCIFEVRYASALLCLCCVMEWALRTTKWWFITTTNNVCVTVAWVDTASREVAIVACTIHSWVRLMITVFPLLEVNTYNTS